MEKSAQGRSRGAWAVGLAGACSCEGDRQLFTGIYIPESSQSAGIYTRGSLLLTPECPQTIPGAWRGPSCPGCWTFIPLLTAAFWPLGETGTARLELFSLGAPSSQQLGLRFPAF